MSDWKERLAREYTAEPLPTTPPVEPVNLSWWAVAALIGAIGWAVMAVAVARLVGL